MRVCGRAVCGYGSSGGLFAFIEGMCVFVHGCVCVSVWGGGGGCMTVFLVMVIQKTVHWGQWVQGEVWGRV